MNYSYSVICSVLLWCLFSTVALSQERVHFLIPGGAGGGWDTSARAVGEALLRAKLLTSVSYENLSGGGGSTAMAHLIETSARQHNTLMVSSTPIILHAIKKISPQTYKNLIPICTVLADYGAFVVRSDSKYKTWQQVVSDFKKNPKRVKVAGGSVRGSMDHLVAAMAFKQSGLDVRQLRYIPYNAGAKAMVGLLSGETQVLSSGLGEAMALAAQGEVRVLAMTAKQRLDYAPDIPTLVEQQVDVVFTNWRGFFAAPNVPVANIDYFQSLIKQMYKTPVWEQIRLNRGWTNLLISGQAFIDFLSQQEQELAEVMKDLGML